LSKKEVLVKFQTLTPLWTGDAWQDNNEIRPSALIGSLRFWFEVICYFSGICDKKDFKNGRFEKEVNRKDFKNCLLKKGNSSEAKIECLLEQGIPLPSIIFGSTNWRSLIEIKDIKYLDDYCFGNKLNLPNKICINKSNYEIKENNNCPKKSNQDWSIFFFSKPYFYGKFQVVFKVEEKVLKSIFYPLLNFMDKYGFWGGKWNIGYGRLKIESENGEKKNWEVEKLDLQIFNINKVIYFNENEKNNSFSILESISNLNNLTQFNDKKIKMLKNQISNNDLNDLKELIKELIKLKAQKRSNFKNNKELRHKIFGKTGDPRNLPYVPQGSKILPYIYEENNELKGGFLSIVGLLNLEGKSND